MPVAIYFLETIAAQEIVPNTALPPLGVNTKIKVRPSLLDSLVDLLETVSVGWRIDHDLVDEQLIVFGRLL